MRRARAIYYCLKFGLLPWQLYESECHYAGWSYWQHLMINMELAWTWLSRQEDADLIEFERETNNNV